MALLSRCMRLGSKNYFRFLYITVTRSIRPEETSMVASRKGIGSYICFNYTQEAVQ